MHKVPVWKPILLVAIMALAIWSLYPPDKRLKPGLDLVGGTTLVYEVQVDPNVPNPRQVLEDTIEVLRKRVDPYGQRNLIWRVQGTNRIEIQMALPPRQTAQLRQAFIQTRDGLIEGNMSERRLDAALKADAAQRDAMLEAIARGNTAVRAALTELASAHDAMMAAREPYETVQQRLREAEATSRALPDGAAEDMRKDAQAQVDSLLQELIPLTQAYNASRAALTTTRQKVLSSNIDPVRLESVLATYDPDVKKTKAREAYAAALQSLKERHPQRADQVGQVADAYEAYAAVKGPLDDPNDLVAMLRGSGVLEFRITAPATLPDAQEYRDELRTRGPRAVGDKPWRWFVIDNPERFAGGDKKEYESLVESPEAYFTSRGMIGAEYAGNYFVLLGNRKDSSIRREDGNWALTQVYATRDDMNFSAIGFTLNTVGGQLMNALTAANLQKPMAITLDGRVLSAPTIQARISDSGIITGGQGGFSQREMQYMLNTLGAGSTQAQLSDAPVSVKTTGPQLGQDNLQRGLKAAIYSVLIVCVFMLVYYLLLGAVADIALFINMVLLLAVMASLQATFTLPGIAGIVLTIGMAVDANVLIFERIREELERKAEVLAAVRLGYEKALSTIIDSNLTTLITCLVLGYTATAEVKGFAVTLGIGICCTLFATLFAGRVLVDLYVQFFRPRSFAMMPMILPPVRKLLTPNIDWLRMRYAFFAISAVLIVAGVAMLYVRGADLLDLEFRSGTQIGFELKQGQTMTLTEVRQRLDKAAAADPDLAVLGGDRAKVVTVGAADGAAASAFSVQVIGDAQTQKISEAIKQAFADVIEAQAPLDFARMDAALRGTDPAPVFVVRQATLGPNIDRVSDVDVSEFVGGVAIVLDDVRPPAAVADVTERIKRMREQPGEHESLGYRPFTVVGLDVAPAAEQRGDAPLYRSFAVVSRDATTNYLESPDLFAEAGGLADTEWRLVRDALQRDTSLASVTSFSSQVSETMKQQAIAAIALSMLAVIAYIWFRFGSFRYGLAAIIALIHDTTIALGLVAICGYIYDEGWAQMLLIAPFKIDLAMVAAMLTLIGYSLNDTIIVFDRIRENRGRLAIATPGIINDSINQTISRTVITSGTTLIALVVLYFVGGPGVHGFAFAMTVGVVIGTYSSIAVAAPFLALIGKIAQRRLAEQAVAAA